MTKSSEGPWEGASQVTVPFPDLWVLLLATVRYSMGRRSYMPGLCVELVERYREALTDQQFTQIVKEVEAELQSAERTGTYLGDNIDHTTWQAFVDKHRNSEGM